MDGAARDRFVAHASLDALREVIDAAGLPHDPHLPHAALRRRALEALASGSLDCVEVAVEHLHRIDGSIDGPADPAASRQRRVLLTTALTLTGALL